MGQPVKLSDRLVLDARVVGEVLERSIASQIELWAALGRAVEPLLRTEQVLRLKRRGATRSLSESLGEVGTAKGRRRVASVIQQRPFPHYAPAPGKPGMLVRTEEDGTRTIGRFRNREFVVAEKKKKRR
jgi:hypothetical protein